MELRGANLSGSWYTTLLHLHVAFLPLVFTSCGLPHFKNNKTIFLLCMAAL